MAYNIYDLMDTVQDDTVALPEDKTVDTGRIKALTRQKLRQQAQRPAGQRTGRFTRGLLIAAAAAVMCTATVAAARLGVADSFKGYFGDLTAAEKQLVEQHGTTDMPAPVTSNGTTITLLAAYGDAYNCYVRLRVAAPEGTVLRIPNTQTEGDLMFRGTEEDGILETEPYDFSGCGHGVSWEDAVPGDNVLEGVLHLEIQMLGETTEQRMREQYGFTRFMRFDDGLPKTLHFTSLAVLKDGRYGEKLLEGDWQFALPALSAWVEPLTVDADGLTVDSTEPGRTIYLDHFQIGDTYTQALYTCDSDPDWVEKPPCEPAGGWALVLADGSEVAIKDDGAFNYSGDRVNAFWRYEAPIDLAEVDHIRFGSLTIPVQQ